MKPITTIQEFGEMEALFRRSERRVIAQFIRSRRVDDRNAPRVQIFDVLADVIESGGHWKDSATQSSEEKAKLLKIAKDFR